MDFFEVTRSRCSYRGEFEEKPVPREDLEKIVQAGLDAPSGCNGQTTEFIVVENPEIIGKIQAIPGANKALANGKAYILCLMDNDPEPVYEKMDFQTEDCSAAVENILLAITALGYGGVWIDGWLRRDNRAETLAELTGVSPEKKVQVIIPLGIPAQEMVRKPKKSLEERVTFL